MKATTVHSWFAWRLGPGLLVAGLLCGVKAAAPAHAAVYCVQQPACVGTDTDLQGALTAAAASTDDDTVQIGPVTLSGSGFRYAPGANGGQLTIQGAGADKTTLTGASIQGTVLEVDEDSANHRAVVQDLGFEVPQKDMVYTSGLSIARGLVQRVHATSPGTVGSPIGLRVGDGTIVRHSVSDMGMRGYAAVEIIGDPTEPESRLEDSTAIGLFGVLVEAGPGRVTRTRIRAYGEGIEACNTEADVDDTLIELHGKYTIGLGVQAGGRCAGDPAAMKAKHVTIVGDGSPPVAGFAALQIFSDPYAATLDLRHSVIRNMARTTTWRTTGTATATIGSTDADLTPGAQDGTPGTLNVLPGNVNVDPRFVDPAAGDYRLLANSPVIDAGPSEPFDVWESRQDILGNPRVKDGNGDGIAARDMGAFEFAPHKPHAKATATPGRIQQGEPFRFSARGSSDPDPGDSLRYVWRFDDGKTARGIVVKHAFSHRGRHHAKVTVTDLAGRHDTDTTTVTVTARRRHA